MLGPEHPATLISVNNLTFCMEALGDAAGALPLYRRAADGFERLFGPDHPSSRTVRANCVRLEQELAARRAGPGRAEPGRPRRACAGRRALVAALVQVTASASILSRRIRFTAAPQSGP